MFALGICMGIKFIALQAIAGVKIFKDLGFRVKTGYAEIRA